jgi:ferredoxin
MPMLTVDGKTAEVPAGSRLVLAIEQQGVAIGHRCGGYARCTTCRVTFVSGEPSAMTVAEFKKLHDAGIYGQYRLSCQIVCSQDMEVNSVMTLDNQGWTDTGPAPEPTVTPDPATLPVAELEAQA